jgi:tetratricopeptide (TPR) repeat protein
VVSEKQVPEPRTLNPEPSPLAPRPLSLASLLLEKLPLFALSAIASGLALWMAILANQPRDDYPIWWRVGNATIAYVTYLWQMLYPVDLVVIRPLPDPVLSPWMVFASASVLAVITIAVWRGRRKYPYLPVGWLWYLGMLVPVAGVVQYGIIAVSDRFTYLPQIGLCIAVSWGVADICRAWPRCRPACVAATTAVVLIWIACTFHQASYWRDSETLWHHAIDCTDDNYVAELNLGVSLSVQKRSDEAKPHLKKAMEIKRDHVIGNCLRGASKYGKDVDKTIEQYWKDFVPPKRDADSIIPDDKP